MKKRVCPVCGRRYSAVPATSRVDGSDICPVCGAAESVFFLNEEQRDEIVRVIEEREIAAGKVEPVTCG